MGPDQTPGPHHPADVRDPEEAVRGFEIHPEVDLLGTLDLDARVRVDDSFRFARRARRVEQHRFLTRVERFRLVLVVLRFDGVGPPTRRVAIVDPGNFMFAGRGASPQSVEDDRVFDVPGLLDRLVSRGLEEDRVAATVEAVADKEHGTLGIRDPGSGCVDAEAREDRHGDRTDLETAIEDRDDFGDHRHVEPHGIACSDTAFLERVRDPVRLPVEFVVGHLPDLAVLAPPRWWRLCSGAPRRRPRGDPRRCGRR